MERETTLLETSKVPGTPVFGKAREEIGSVDELIIDTANGKVRYAVISFGGVLGIGKSHFPIPWRSMTWNTELGGYIIGVTSDQLKNAPDYDPAYFDNREWETKIHQNYGTAGYWESEKG